MTEEEFFAIKEKNKIFNYSSMKYIDYSAVANYDILLKNENILLLYGYNTESGMNEYHWATNDNEELINKIGRKSENVLVTFIPVNWVSRLEKVGFKVFAKWNDYFMNNIENIYYEYESEFLNESECQYASLVTRACKGQSRGFLGQTEEWVRSWLRGDESLLENMRNNAIIICRNNSGEIVGVLCTATYAHESENGAVVWVREVAVKPEYQGQGIGRKLILQALSYGKNNGAKRAFLAADECNENAIHLYESIGFTGNIDEVQIDMFK